jgi:hypothetical protein
VDNLLCFVLICFLHVMGDDVVMVISYFDRCLALLCV